MKKNLKVVVVHWRMNNGHCRTVHTIVPLSFPLSEIYRIKDIPLMSIIFTKVSPPLTEAEAWNYLHQDYLMFINEPSIGNIVKIMYTEETVDNQVKRAS